MNMLPGYGVIALKYSILAERVHKLGKILGCMLTGCLDKIFIRAKALIILGNGLIMTKMIFSPLNILVEHKQVKESSMQDFTGHYGGLPLEKETIMSEELQYPNTGIVIKVGDRLYSKYWDTVIEVTNINQTAKMVETITIEYVRYTNLSLNNLTEQGFMFKQRSDAQLEIVRLENTVVKQRELVATTLEINNKLRAKINKRDDLLQQVWDWNLERDKGAHHIDIIKRQIAKLGETG